VGGWQRFAIHLIAQDVRRAHRVVNRHAAREMPGELELERRARTEHFLALSSAILAPVNAYLPLSAAGPLTGSTMPILIVSPSARATRKNPGAARLAPRPRDTDRLVSLMRSSPFSCFRDEQPADSLRPRGPKPSCTCSKGSMVLILLPGKSSPGGRPPSSEISPITQLNAGVPHLTRPGLTKRSACERYVVNRLAQSSSRRRWLPIFRRAVLILS
jgi:hypothetical protein